MHCRVKAITTAANKKVFDVSSEKIKQNLATTISKNQLNLHKNKLLCYEDQITHKYKNKLLCNEDQNNSQVQSGSIASSLQHCNQSSKAPPLYQMVSTMIGQQVAPRYRNMCNYFQTPSTLRRSILAKGYVTNILLNN